MKKSVVIVFAVYACLAEIIKADLYLHNMRGSNNRINENSAARRNANRLFDSQNNNRGGYNVGDKTDEKAGARSNYQYQMKYFQSAANKGTALSYLTIEWTNQHGCGGNEDTDPEKQNCNMVLQYMCQQTDEIADGVQDAFRDGVNTQTPKYTNPPKSETTSRRVRRKKGNNDIKRGQQELWDWYDKCYTRERNKGLFTADQKLKTQNSLKYSGAIYTRQNPNGNRYGYECPEERDYYPYWHPNPWKDIAVLAQNSSLCSYYQKNSFNTQPYGECIETYSAGQIKPSRWNNPKECKDNGGTWTQFYNYLEKATKFGSQSACNNANSQYRSKGVKFIWQVPYDTNNPAVKECLVALESPDCMEAPWSRSNHLGNGRNGEANNYTWVLPYFPSEKRQRCIFRIRYNISTDDYDPYRTDSKSNPNWETGKFSPVQQNPYVDIGAGKSPLRLAINTAQYGRVFQDRSHVFMLEPRPSNMKTQKIYNLNVRGKRGNIVQVYPAVEYDFFPTTLNIKEKDLVHIQWTGSNSHNNGNPAGDGQAGDAGEGKGGTDRNNFVQIMDMNENYPLPYEQSTMFSDAEVVWVYHGKKSLSKKDLAINLASSGYYQCLRSKDCSGESVETKTKINSLLNNAPASYEGVVLKFKKNKYHYMCTRNNNFTNRSQKATIIVS